jgi:UDP-N-acetylglucosamine transferase subunit ALG13
VLSLSSFFFSSFFPSLVVIIVHNLGNYIGSGTILDVLRRGKPLIIVPNPTLLDNHQEDMAHAMELLGHAKVSTTR